MSFPAGEKLRSVTNAEIVSSRIIRDACVDSEWIGSWVPLAPNSAVDPTDLARFSERRIEQPRFNRGEPVLLAFCEHLFELIKASQATSDGEDRFGLHPAMAFTFCDLIELVEVLGFKQRRF